jgi:cysteine-rich repeat protein
MPRQPLALLALLLLVPRGAAATVVGDVCTGDPLCVLRATVSITAGTGTLDFGAREFRIARTGRLRLPGAEVLVVRARRIVLEAGAQVDHTGALAPARGASLTLAAGEELELQKSGPSRARLDLSASQAGGRIQLDAGGDVLVSGDLSVHGLESPGDGGSIEVTAGGHVTVDGDLKLVGAAGGTGGELVISAPRGRVVLNGSVDAAGGSEGGTIEIVAGPLLTSTGVLDASGVGNPADGGTVDMDAAGELTLGGRIVTFGSGGFGEGAIGGDVTVRAGGTLTAGAQIVAFGGGDGGTGAAIDLEAGPLLTITAPIDVGNPRGDGGSIAATADEVRVQAELNANGDGGDISLGTRRPLATTVAGPVTITGNVHASGASGSIFVEGCDVSVPAAGRLTTDGAPGGENFLQASGQMTIAGTLSARSDGRNLLQFRDRAPVLGPNITPAAIQQPTPTLRPCAGVPVCGNGVREPGEECDDDNLTACDGCSATCQLEVCGDGRAECTEACDDGNAVDGDACDTNCTRPACGNGIVAGAEQCDDGNTVSGDGCTANCRIECAPGCGDGIQQPGEECDDGNDVPCDACDCCRVPRCGDNIGCEECDDGNTRACDGCSPTCQTERLCGNGVVECDEQCDDGAENGQPGSECNAACHRCSPGSSPDCPCAVASDCQTTGLCGGAACEAGVCTSVPPEEPNCTDDGDVCNGTAACDPDAGCVRAPALSCSDTDDCTDERCDPVEGCVFPLRPGFAGLTCRVNALEAEVQAAARGDLKGSVRRTLRQLVAGVRGRARKAERSRKPAKALTLLAAARRQLGKLGSVVETGRARDRIEPALAERLVRAAGQATVALDAVSGSITPGS